MKKTIRFISKFEKNGEKFIEVIHFKNEPPLNFYKKFFMKLARCMKNIGYQMKLQK